MSWRMALVMRGKKDDGDCDDANISIYLPVCLTFKAGDKGMQTEFWVNFF